jgi:putative ABC transport system substrate-binding protein
MQRREFIGLIGATTLSSARPGQAQTGTGLPLVGVIMPFKPDADIAKPRISAIRKGLQDVGLVEGTNYSLILRFASGDLGRWPSLAEELGALNPRVIVTVGYGLNIIHGILPRMPVVFTAISIDPVSAGIAKSWARPGGMMTGNVMNAAGGEPDTARHDR